MRLSVETDRDPRTHRSPDGADVGRSLYPCAGVYAVAEATGTIRKDDRVSLA